MIRPEILSPAGDIEKLRTVIDYGADAVYMSGKSYGLRTFSGNFTREEMKEGIDYAHSKGVKCYVTMNIYALENDLKDMDDQIDFVAHEAGADAVLVSDPGIFMKVKRVAPDLELHISTQASVTNSEACRFWYEQGARRIVLARELSLEQIKEIRKNIPEDLELECFVHGAMCVSYSGRCILSNYFTGRRSNGGACAQPCRWGYSLVEEKRPEDQFPVEQDQRGTYILSSKDICMADHVPDLIEAGITSFKIEGRIKGAYYAAAATKVYREAVDRYMKDPASYETDPHWNILLDKVVHRDYDTGFFYGDPMDDAAIASDKTYNKPAFVVGVIESYDKSLGLYRISQRNKVYCGDILNVLKPEGYEAPVKITEMFDEQMNPITDAPHPQMIFYARLEREEGHTEPLGNNTFLSRDGDKDEGILPNS
ncbi:MAG: U32 family peptidase [Clostridiales bacterium]|nr:U32 family peptidase [Clostridiales bacterium]